MPVYNAEAFLPECLDSILLQDQQNWELVAVENGSTDQSYAVLNEYASNNPRIRIFQNLEKGIIPALQKAYLESKGTFITRMDADDVMRGNKLNLLKNALANNKVDSVAVGQVEYFSESGIGDGYKKYELWLNDLLEHDNSFRDIYKECVIPSPCWMIHRTNFERIGAFNSEVYPEDYDLTFRMYKHKLKIVPVLEKIHLWRDYVARSSRVDPNYSDNRFLDIKMNYFLELDYQSDRNLSVWGAGKKGKFVAKYLLDHDVPFDWLSNNEKKVGKDIYGKIIQHSDNTNPVKSDQYLVLVGNPDEQKAIEATFAKASLEKSKDYFFFC